MARRDALKVFEQLGMCPGTGGHALLGRCPSCRGSGRTRYIRHLDAGGVLVDVEIL